MGPVFRIQSVDGPDRIGRALLALACCVFLASPLAAQDRAAGGPLRFDLFAFNVAGNTVLSVAEVETAVYPFLGPERSLADAEAARAALERLYQDRGFLSVVVTLPPQALSAGELTLQVVEGRVAERRVSGARWHLPSAIEAATPSLQPGTVPAFDEMQAELGRVQTADLQVTPAVTTGSRPQDLQIDLQVKDSAPLHASVELNSKQSFNTSRGRLEASLRYDNFFQRRHSAGLTWIAAPGNLDDANTWVASHGMPLGGDDGRLSTTLVVSRSATPSSLGGATVVRGETLGSRWRRPLDSRDPALQHAALLGAEWKHNRDRNLDSSGGADASPGLRYGTFQLGWEAAWSDDTGPVGGADALLSLGFSGPNGRIVDCNGRRLDQFACKRSGATPDFQVLRLSGWRRIGLPAGYGLTVRAQAQLAGQPLGSGEQFGAGGLDTVRGYHEYEQVGDQGLVLRLEAASPTFDTVKALPMQGVAFLEGAALFVHEPLPGEPPRIGMAGAGLGLRAQAPYGLQLKLDVAWPLRATLKPDTGGNRVAASGRGSGNVIRVDFSVRHAF